MNAEDRDSDGETASLLDRLVCGELDETSRGALVAWLEADPLRWRLCGLAFLEAQTWSHALAAWPVPERQSRRPARTIQPAVGKPRARIWRVAHAAALAACVLAAFGLGLASRPALVPPKSNSAGQIAAGGPTNEQHESPTDDTGRSSQEGKPVLASVSVQPGAGLGAEATLQIPVVPAGRDRAPAVIPDYVRQQWQRRGYRLSIERRYLFANLPDGERVVVPVERIHADYVGSKVY